MDLDNLLKRFFDALQKTVFKNVAGGDGCVIELEARKIRVDSDEEAGADLEIKPIAGVADSCPQPTVLMR
jgi:Holliday junction resolvase RusA-like endonuclease